MSVLVSSSSVPVYLLVFLLSVGPGWYVRGLSAEYWNRNFDVGPGVFLNTTSGDVTLVKALGKDGSETLKPSKSLKYLRYHLLCTVAAVDQGPPLQWMSIVDKFSSHKQFQFGTFSMRLKLPSGFSAGIVSTVYLSSMSGEGSAGASEATRDEIDFEFLGSTHPRGIVVSTNYYSQGRGQSTHEEGFRLWFDPSAAFHDYRIQWSRHQVIFWVDRVPIRIIQRQGKDCSEFPCQPMGIQGSVWDASIWATQGGRIKANYEFAPFQLTVRDLNVWRSMVCHVHLPERKCMRKKGVWNRRLTRYQHLKMAHYRHKLLIYSNVVGCGNLNRPPCSQVAT